MPSESVLDHMLFLLLVVLSVPLLLLRLKLLLELSLSVARVPKVVMLLGESVIGAIVLIFSQKKVG